MSGYYFHVTVRHEGLGKYRVIRGADRTLVEAAAYAQQRTWNEQYAKRVEVAERRRERDERKQELEDSVREADERTRVAQDALDELRIMGIDIGSVRRVAQLDPPWSVASMRQRLGRSGRRDGESARMCLYSRDESPNSASSLTDLLFPKLLRTVALARLMLSKWLEPHDGDRLHLSTLVHQILSCLRETGGMPATALFAVLVRNGAFRVVTETMLRRVLRALGIHELVEQLPTGELILAPKGERITSDRDFYAAFASSEEFVIRHDGREIGKLQSSLVPPVGENLILGGRRWCVNDINATAITQANAEVLRAAIQSAAASSNEAEARGDNGFGELFNLRFAMTTGRGSATVLTGWIVLHNEDFPRLTTCYIV